MKFLDKVLLKQNVKSNINAINLIYEKAEECLEPLVEIYIIHYLGHELEYETTKLKDLSLALTSLSGYLRQLHRASSSIKADMSANPDVLKRFAKSADLALKKVEKLHKDIFGLDVDIRNIPSYEDYEELLKGLHYLTRLEEEIKQMNGVPMDIVPKNAKQIANTTL